jgi:hypothetical protein
LLGGKHINYCERGLASEELEAIIIDGEGMRAVF